MYMECALFHAGGVFYPVVLFLVCACQYSAGMGMTHWGCWSQALAKDSPIDVVIGACSSNKQLNSWCSDAATPDLRNAGRMVTLH